MSDMLIAVLGLTLAAVVVAGVAATARGRWLLAVGWALTARGLRRLLPAPADRAREPVAAAPPPEIAQRLRPARTRRPPTWAGAYPALPAGDPDLLPAQVVAGCERHHSFFHGTRQPIWGNRLIVRGAALRGVTHAAEDAAGQDVAGALWDEQRQALYVAVADGLGSLAHSGRVAVEAVQAALHLCTTRPAGLDFAGCGDPLFEAIGAGLRRSLGPADQLGGASTLVVAEILARTGGAEVTVHGLGDSEAWALHDGNWCVLHHERDGRRDHSTRELPTHTHPVTVSHRLPPGAALLVASDGFAGALDTAHSPLAEQLAMAWREAPPAVDFVRQVGYRDDYWRDDRSAVAVWIGEGRADG